MASISNPFVQKNRLWMVSVQADFYLGYLAHMESYFESGLEKQLNYRKQVELELEQISAKFLPVEPNSAGYISPDYEVHPEIEILVNELRVIDDMELGMINSFSNLARRSFFVTIYSFLETQLSSECLIREAIINNVFVLPEQSKVNNIFKSKKYFESVGFGQVFQSPEWKEIEYYNKLRNCIVHDDGKLGTTVEMQALKEYINSKATLSLAERQAEIIIDKGYCDESLGVIADFIKRVITA